MTVGFRHCWMVNFTTLSFFLAVPDIAYSRGAWSDRLFVCLLHEAKGSERREILLKRCGVR